ncbi:hypothetical protein R1sor_018363 [Riccia sorocarpa]|uniref:RING-type E3 ubiquitin transferase n=1 Tax=Riccia sorocarpa TaxID=122646 RepID=A0ABD3I9X4_9MARC
MHPRERSLLLAKEHQADQVVGKKAWRMQLANLEFVLSLKNMEDSSDARRGVPLVSGSTKQGSCWPPADMHYPLTSSNYASGSGSNIGSSRLSRMDETHESWQNGRVYGQDNGKGPAVQKSSQVSPKIVTSRSSGVRRSQRSLSEATAHGQWNALHNLSTNSDEPGLGNMDSDSNLGIGLSTRMGLSEVPSLAGHGRASGSQDFSLGRSGIPTSRNSDSYSGHFSGYSSMGPEVNLERGSGQVGDRLGSTRGSGSSGLPVSSRSSLLASNVTHRSNSRRSVLDGGRIEDSQGLAITSSLLGERHGIEGEELHHENVLSDPFIAGARSIMLGEEAAPTGSSEPPFALGAVSLDRAQCGQNQNSEGILLRNSMSSNTSSGYKSGISTSRGSSCKRKSCTPGLLGSSCRSASPQTSTSREGYVTRTTGGSSSGRRSGNLGCASASAVVPSTSAVTGGGRCAEASVSTSAPEEPRPRKVSTSRDLESGPGRAGKSTFVGSSSGGSGSRSTRSGSAGGNMEQTTLPSQPPFTRAVRRAIPALQPDSWCSRRGVSLADCSTDTDFSSAGGSTLVRSSEQLMTAGVRRSGSPLVTGNSRTGNTASPRRNDSHTGTTSVSERVSHRYVGSGGRSSLTSGSSNPASFGGIGSESRLRLRNSSLDGSSSSPANTAVQSEGGLNTSQQGITGGGPGSMPSPSRLPPHPPVVRSRHSHVLNSPIPVASSSGPAPSRIPPSPPNVSPSLSTALDILPPGTNIFQSSFLPRTSFREGRSERGLASAAESLFGMPFRGLQSPSDGENQPRMIAEGLAEILLALERVERDEDLTYEQLLMLEATLLFGGMGLHDQHSDLRLDVDNMSYEELLALEERIGNVSTGLDPETVSKRLKRSKYSTRSVIISVCSQESDVKCSICQEEYEDGDELGKIDCGHSYHVACIKQWLVQKNQCPICKASALSS